ncbi:hypothetical protein CEE45_08215 [Candidatus Heimdallarchaeota archaeon B3_Heim]|nr:MAG: hypothetical protein CEE45_08215 [Candidatus Heimdallarchaeota archaeon B3_Heim]
MSDYRAEEVLEASAVNVTKKREMSLRVVLAMTVLGGFFSFAATYADMTTGIFSGWAFMFVAGLIISRYFAWTGEKATKQELGLVLAATPALSSSTVVFWIQFATHEKIIDAGITLPWWMLPDINSSIIADRIPIAVDWLFPIIFFFLLYQIGILSGLGFGFILRKYYMELEVMPWPIHSLKAETVQNLASGQMDYRFKYFVRGLIGATIVMAFLYIPNTLDVNLPDLMYNITNIEPIRSILDWLPLLNPALPVDDPGTRGKIIETSIFFTEELWNIHPILKGAFFAISFNAFFLILGFLVPKEVSFGALLGALTFSLVVMPMLAFLWTIGFNPYGQYADLSWFAEGINFEGLWSFLTYTSEGGSKGAIMALWGESQSIWGISFSAAIIFVGSMLPILLSSKLLVASLKDLKKMRTVSKQGELPLTASLLVFFGVGVIYGVIWIFLSDYFDPLWIIVVLFLVTLFPLLSNLMITRSLGTMGMGVAPSPELFSLTIFFSGIRMNYPAYSVGNVTFSSQQSGCGYIAHCVMAEQINLTFWKVGASEFIRRGIPMLIGPFVALFLWSAYGLRSEKLPTQAWDPGIETSLAFLSGSLEVFKILPLLLGALVGIILVLIRIPLGFSPINPIGVGIGTAMPPFLIVTMGIGGLIRILFIKNKGVEGFMDIGMPIGAGALTGVGVITAVDVFINLYFAFDPAAITMIVLGIILILVAIIIFSIVIRKKNLGYLRTPKNTRSDDTLEE